MAGRPSWLSTDKDRDMVGSMAAYRIPQDAIAAVPKINKPTVLRRCRHEVDVGFAEINAVAREIDVSGGDERSLLGATTAQRSDRNAEAAGIRQHYRSHWWPSSRSRRWINSTRCCTSMVCPSSTIPRMR